MATQPSEEQENANQTELAADIENVLTSVGLAASQSGGASEISENIVDEPYYRPLLRAALKGEWESATRFFEQDAASKTAKITSRSETLLHVAALSAQDQFLENLVELLSPYPEVLEMVDCDGRTALHNAVPGGRIRMVKALVRSNPRLTQLRDKEGRVPLGISAKEASMHKEIAWFLAKSTTDDEPSHPSSDPFAIDIIIDLIRNGYHDIALYLVGRYPHLITSRGGEGEPANYFRMLDVLARNESHFSSGTKLTVTEALIYNCIPVGLNSKATNENSDPAFQRLTRSLWNATKIIVPKIKRIHEMKLRNVAAIMLAEQVFRAISHGKTTEIIDFFEKEGTLYEATARGITEIMNLCIEFFPEFIWIRHNGGGLVTEAVKHRREGILRLLLTVSPTNKLSLVRGPTEAESKEMMSAAAKYGATGYCPRFSAKTVVAEAAFQMQREVLWYRVSPVDKAVESWVIPFVASASFGHKTYWKKFMKNHKGLTKKGEKWVKETANSCIIVSTLIATVLFAAAFTVPGGNDGKTGVPLLLGQDYFHIFAISDALGFFSSVMTILLFLTILTLRYEAQDFLYALPKKIIMGLSLLFLSLAFMLAAFVATLAMVLDKRLEWALITITLLACVPVALFAAQLPLLLGMVIATYGPSIFRPKGICN